jgi:hypothetical protein
MVLQITGNPTIDNIHRYPQEIVDKLRGLLHTGAVAYPDRNRKGFYDVENGTRIFYVHLSPSGKVLLLASWLKDVVPKECQDLQLVGVCTPTLTEFNLS